MKLRPSDEEIARALREHAREEDATAADPRWDALARGDASAEDIAALERMAADDPAAGEALALFRPVGDAAQSRYADAIIAELGRGAEAAPAVKAAPPRIEPPVKRRAIRWVAPAAAGLAMAAAIALFVGQRSPGGALPSYAVTFSGGEATSRSEPVAPVPELAAGSRFTIALRPATSVAGSIGARVFLVQGDTLEPVEAEVKVSADGAVRLSVRLGDAIDARAGGAEIVAVVARPEALPPATARARDLVEGGDRRVIRQPVRIVERR